MYAIFVAHYFVDTFLVRFQKRLGGFLLNVCMRMANFVLKNILNFLFLNDKTVLVTNFFRSITHKYDEFSANFSTLND